MWHGLLLLLLLGFAGASVEDPNLVGGGPRASLTAYSVELERGDRFIAKKARDCHFSYGVLYQLRESVRNL
jgi:hypothetical protein